MKGALAVLVVVAACLNVTDGVACTAPWKLTPEELVAKAELIVRATAIEYEVSESRTATTGVANSKVRFRIESVLKGAYASNALTLTGVLSDRDDWNPQMSPYTSGRSGGSSGGCSATEYRTGGQFLLMLQRVSNPTIEGAIEYTVNWTPLAPKNEQVRSDDPWVKWVDAQIGPQRTHIFSVAVRREPAPEEVTVTHPTGLTEIEKKLDEIGFWDDGKFLGNVRVPYEFCAAPVGGEKIELVAARGSAAVKRVTLLNPNCARVREFKPAQELLDVVALIKQWSQAKP